MDKFLIIGNVLSVISYIVFWGSTFFKDKKNILRGHNISKIITIISFIFLKSFDGIYSNIYGIVRNKAINIKRFLRRIF